MSRKKSIEEIKQVVSETMETLKPKYEAYQKLCDALITNHNEFPRASKFHAPDGKDFNGLNQANDILRDANLKIDDKFTNSHAEDPSYRKHYEEATKKSKELTTDFPEVNNRLPMIIIFLVIGLAFVIAYIIGNVLKKIPIPLDDPFPMIIWVVVVAIGGIFVLLGALFAIFFIVNMSAMYADLKDRLHEAKMLRKGNNQIIEEMEGKLSTLDNALKAIILVEDAAFDQIKKIPEGGEYLFSVKDSIGKSVTLIYENRAKNLTDALGTISNESQLEEIKEILAAQQSALTALIKEMKIQNKIAIAAFSDSDLEI